MRPAERILAVLSDGGWHSSAELGAISPDLMRELQRLRKQGFEIQQRPAAPTWEYRLRQRVVA